MEIEGHYVSDYIRIYKNVFNKPTLNKIKKYAKDKPSFANIKNSTVYLSDQTKKDVVDESRTSTTESMNTFITNSMTNVRLTNIIISYFNFYGRKYVDTVLPIDEMNPRIEQIDLVRYEKGSYFNRHYDHGWASNRILSYVFLINKDYKGGELEFFLPNNPKSFLTINDVENTLIIFPSNFMYPHFINPITEGERYSIVAWAR